MGKAKMVCAECREAVRRYSLDLFSCRLCRCKCCAHYAVHQNYVQKKALCTRCFQRLDDQERAHQKTR